MKNETLHSDNPESLRRKAELSLTMKSNFRFPTASEADVRALIHELEVHQIELEMQNEELLAARSTAEEAKEKFVALYDFAPAGYFTLDIEYRICELNLSGAKMLGNDRSVLINRDFLMYVFSEDRATFVAFLKELAASGLKKHCEVRLALNGIPSFSIHLEGLLNDKEYLINAVDITEHMKAQQQLAENEIRLSELNATKDKFLSLIAHDLRSPFNSISGFSNMLTERIKENNYSEIAEYAVFIQKSSVHALELLSNLLLWAGTQTGKIAFNPVATDITKIISDVIEIMKDTAGQKSISITKVFACEIPVKADKEMIATILRNLISNSIKFTNPGGRIVVSTNKYQNGMMITVSDNGVGIPKESVANLLKIESKASTNGTNNEKGTGLGLIICKEFVEKHGGKLTVESEPGKGSTFSFTI